MAGDWIKFDTTTPDKPEVWQIAGELEIDPDAVVGKLLRVWAWFDSQTEKGNAPSVTKALLDRRVGVTGFVSAMISAGWMVENGGVLEIPNFDFHNSETAKRRALTAKRVSKHKNSNARGNAKVTLPALPNALPREEKRREEKIEEKKEELRGKAATRPSVDEVRQYCQERGNGIDADHFHDHYTANGWKQSNGNAIRDWRAAVRTWEKNRVAIKATHERKEIF